MKRPKRQEANQLAAHKCGREVAYLEQIQLLVRVGLELGITRFKVPRRTPRFE